MRRFKVKDLVISQVPGAGLLGDKKCAENDAATRVECKPDEDEKLATRFACRIGSDTGEACGANSDTSWRCGDAETLLPCRESEKTSPCFKDTKVKCADMPNKEHQTHFRCVETPDDPANDTKIPCKRGSVTGIPGWRDEPWRDCLHGSASRKPCAEQFNTYKECLNKGDKRTKYACQTPQAERTKFPCKIDEANTKNQCWQFDTGCSWGTCWGACTDFTIDQTPLAAAGVVGCPPLSQLHLPAEDPGTVEALADLHADLREALRLVEDRQEVVAEILAPATVAEVEELEQALAGALDEARALKERLAGQRASEPGKGEPSGAS
ncbi:MAG: hypothetical protein ACYDH6_21555 [Acidimicrobiales bacterium]